MPEIDGILSELGHRIMGPFESGAPKPATQEMDSPVKRSAVVALRRLTHPERDGGLVVEDDPATKPINPERGVVVGDDPISPLIRPLARHAQTDGGGCRLYRAPDRRTEWR
jgi:hypothetical protein